MAKYLQKCPVLMVAAFAACARQNISEVFGMLHLLKNSPSNKDSRSILKLSKMSCFKLLVMCGEINQMTSMSPNFSHFLAGGSAQEGLGLSSLTH